MRRLITAAVLGGLLLASAGCGLQQRVDDLVRGASGGADSTPSAVASSAPTDFNIYGAVTVTEYIGISGVGAGDTCESDSGYDDIADGAQVSVEDSTGAEVGFGNLEPGTITADLGCRYPFNVQGVPEGGDIYKVRVGNSFRGYVSYHREDLNLAIEIGFD